MTPEPTPTEPELITDEFLITKQFRTADEFSLYIEQTAAQQDISCIERIVEYCESIDIDVEAASVLVNKSLREKIQAEGEGLNLLRKSGRGKLSF